MEIALQCRVCMGNDYDCLNIYSGLSSDQNPIYEVINYVYDLEISIDDGLPENVCQDCLGIIKEFEKYKRNAHRAKNQLISLREKNKMWIKVELEIIDGDATSMGKIHKPQRVSESGIDVCRDAGSPHWLQKVDSDGFNLTEDCCSDMIKYSGNEEPAEVTNQTDDEGAVNIGCDSSDLCELKMVDNHGGNDITYKRGMEEIESEGGSSGSCMQRESVKEEVNGKDRVSCNYCGEIRGTLEELKEHIHTRHFSVFVSKEKKVSDSESTEKRYKCNLCDIVFQYQSNLAEHLRDHPSEMLFKCNLCDYSCVKRSELRIHKRTHKGEKSHLICKYCGKSCLHSSHLKEHIRKHTGEKPFKCPYCEYSSALKGTLNTHLRRHSSERPFKCDYCEFSCYTKGNLQVHLKKHSVEKPYKCELCDFSSTHSGSLKRHALQHSDKKPFKCLYCEHRCSTRYHLKEHTRKHTGEKPYECEICEFRCSQTSILMRHRMKHTGEKRYKCGHCEFSSYTNGNLQVHLKRHIGEVTF